MCPPGASRLDCVVDLPDDFKLGRFSNAFRVVEDTEQGFLLDFLVYSAREKQASVVYRVRVSRQFLLTIRDHLTETLLEIGPPFDDLTKSGAPPNGILN